MLYNTKVIDYGNGLIQYRIHKKDIDSSVAKANGLKREGVKAVRYDDVDGMQVNVNTGELRDDESIVRSLKNSARRSKDGIWGIAQANSWEWFLTLTFNPDKVDSYSYDDCVKLVSKWFNNCKNRKAESLKWLCVPEQHKSGRWHFHALVSNTGNLLFTRTGHKSKSGLEIYNISDFKYGFTTATKVGDSRKASSYLCKYVTKDLQEKLKNKRRYMASKNVKKPTESRAMLLQEDIYSLMLDDNLLYTKQVKPSTDDDLITYITLLRR